MHNELIETLPRRAKKLLKIIQTWSGEWVTRVEIVNYLNSASQVQTLKRHTRYLSAADQAHLKTLVIAGLIEETKEEVDTPIGYRWKYRAVRYMAADKTR